MEVLLKACASGELPANVVFVGSDKESAKGLATAKSLGAETIYFNYKEGRRTAEKIIADAVKSRGVEWIVLAGFMRILSPEFVREFSGKIINIHPALLPKYGGKGMYGDNVHKAVVANGEKESGITIHYVNDKYDDGQIIFQAKCEVLPTDTADDVAKKVHQLEYRYFPEIIEKVVLSL